MKPVTHPLKLQMEGAKVGGLQEALTLLGLTIVDAEKTARRYGASTRQAVSKFQTEHQLPTTGAVPCPGMSYAPRRRHVRQGVVRLAFDRRPRGCGLHQRFRPLTEMNGLTRRVRNGAPVKSEGSSSDWPVVLRLA